MRMKSDDKVTGTNFFFEGPLHNSNLIKNTEERRDLKPSVKRATWKLSEGQWPQLFEGAFCSIPSHYQSDIGGFNGRQELWAILSSVDSEHFVICTHGE
ncbi:hypothetical protein QCA50_011473 [Cerrena zonata]|uniref:Uncharacterized protein n=1 Tax=Cerrena zonata TaxID=2478898 RepID=A0AAW0G7G6_9APHY